ncbi:TOM1-like protein 9 isoform X2 [Eucalyptus grandis]|uniref:TOM1-like protein 9 isoform X2 n=1 Tax=Eucalyptus grandis TaxID=71139 RepID=UPI00192EE047|nr:TOM1-like protein 9 isoform X2 [Eucalyptus grandis]
MPNTGSNEHDQSPFSQSSVPVWNGHIAQQQQPPSPVYGAQTSDSLPPPPWEAQSVENSQVMGTQYPQQMQGSQVVVLHAQPALNGLHLQAPYPMGNEQAMGMYLQPVAGGHMPLLNSQVVPINQMVGLTTSAHPRRSLYGMVPQPMQVGQMAYLYPQQMYGSQVAAYGYGQQGAQYLDQRMYGLSVRDDSSLRNSSYQVSTSSYVLPMKPSKPEDKLFGDLVDMAKVKSSAKSTPGRAGSM